MGTLIDRVERGRTGQTTTGRTPEDGLRRVFVFVGNDAGARATNLLQAAPVRRGAGKSGQSPKGSQGLSNLLRWEGGLGWHWLIS